MAVATASSDAKSYITAFCRPCQAPRYRSIKPMSRKDESRPEFFKAVDADAPAPVEGRARCYLCQDILVFMADSNLPPLKSEPVRLRSQPTDVTIEQELFHRDPDEPLPLVVPHRPMDEPVETLFELGTGEELKSFQDYPDAILLVTNKRIVRVRKG